MVDTVNNVKVRVSAENVSGASRDMARWKSNFEKATGGAAASMQRAERQIVASQDRIANALRNTAAIFGVGIGANEIVKAADSYTKLTNGLIAAGTSAEDFANVQDRLYSAAQRNGTQAEALSQLYRRAALAGDALGVSQESLLNLTDGVAAALRVEGISAQEARGPLLQLGQALASPIVRAEELNSIMEGVPEIARAAARGFGVSVAEMRTAILDGEVTNKAFFQALQIGLVETEKLAEKIPLTIGNSFTVLGDALARYIGQTDDSLSATERISEAIQALANNLDKIVPVLAIISTVIGVRLAGSMLATAGTSGVLGTAIFALQARMAGAATTAEALSLASKKAGASMLAAFGGPVGLAVTALTGAILALSVASGEASKAADDLYDATASADRAIGRADTIIKETTKNTKTLSVQTEIAADRMDKFAGKTGEAAQQLYEYAKAQKAATIADLEREREQVSANLSNAQLRSRDRRRSDFWDEINFSGRNAPSAQESFARGMRFFGGEINRLWTGGVSDLDIDRSIDEGIASLGRLDAKIAETRQSALDLFTGGFTQPSLGGGGGSGTSSKASKDRQAEMRQRLENERRLAEVRATGNAKAIQDEEDRQRLAELTASYTEAGYENAAELAKEVMGYEIRIRDLAKEREEIEKRREEYIDRAGKLLDRFEDRQNAIADFAREELEHRQEIARLTGDKAGEEAARRELMLVEQIARYRSIGMNTADATAAANRRVDEIISAEKRGELRDTFAKSFSEGIRAIAAGDIQSFAANMAGSFAEQALQRLGENVFDAIFGTSENIQTGTEIGLAQNSVLTPALIAASATMATTLSAAITTAGTAAAAAIGAAMGSAGAVSAFSSLPSFAGGGYTGNSPRSGGLDGKGGFLAMMHPRETVNDLTRGMPSPSSLTGSRGAMEVKQSFTINAQGSILASDIVKEIHRVGAQAVSVAVDRSGRNMRKSLPSAMSKLDRYGTP